MSYDLEVATVQAPVEQQVRTFLTQHRGVVVEGSLGKETNLLVSKQTSTGSLPLFTLDGPDEIDLEASGKALASCVPTARWTLLIAVAEGARPEGVRLAQALARDLALRGKGAVYDLQTDEVLRPGGQRARPAQPEGERVSVLKIVWVFPLSRLTEEAVAQFLDLLRGGVPAAMPRQKSLMTFWHGGEAAERPFDSRSWQGRPPGYGGSVTIRRAADSPVVGAVPAWSISLSVDASAITRDRQLRAAVVDLFESVAANLGAIYAGAFVTPDYIWQGGELLRDNNTADHLIPIWNGLPAFPTWLAWFGPPYRPVVAAAFPAGGVEEHPAGLMLRMGELPAHGDELRARFPSLPSELIQHSRIEAYTEHYASGYQSRGIRPILEVADFIPPFS